jgi:hypothetical protein
LGLITFVQAKHDRPRSALIEWILAAALAVGGVLAYVLNLGAEIESGSNRPWIIVLAVAVIAGPAILAGEFLRRTSEWALSPVKVGAIVFLASYLLINTVYFVIRLKEAS